MKKSVLKIKSVLCYTGMLAFLFLKTKDKFLLFHAKQGAALFITALLALVIPVIGWILVWPFVFICSGVGVIKAMELKKWNAPIIHRFIK